MTTQSPDEDFSALPPPVADDLVEPADDSSEKSWATAWWLSATLGWVGADRFYTGKVWLGILKLLSVGGLSVWWAIDLLLLMLGKYKDSTNRLLYPPAHLGYRWVGFGVVAVFALAALANALGA
jgi:TM2 domain-containing membrane protein YozV